MNDSLGSSHVDALDGKAKVVFTFWGADSRLCVTHASAEFALDSLIAIGCFCVGKNALLLALDVCHGEQGYRPTPPTPTAHR